MDPRQPYNWPPQQTYNNGQYVPYTPQQQQQQQQPQPNGYPTGLSAAVLSHARADAARLSSIPATARTPTGSDTSTPEPAVCAHGPSIPPANATAATSPGCNSIESAELCVPHAADAAAQNTARANASPASKQLGDCADGRVARPPSVQRAAGAPTNAC
jgi:hypothetical protein